MRRTTAAIDTGTAPRVAQSPVLVDDRYDHAVRWRPGERLHHLFEDICDRLRNEGSGSRLAVSGPNGNLTYDELDAQANRLARHLASRGVHSGDRVGLLFDQAILGYVGMLATLKLNAAYVPLDPGFPPDRLEYILEDSGARTVVTLSHLGKTLTNTAARLICLDQDSDLIDARPGWRLYDYEREAPVDELCYLIYTSGSTGRPKGVAIEQASICNFVRVAAEVYGIVPEDRVYQGMTIAFDFSVEEIWVPWMVGATLVPKPAGGGALVGQDLHDYLVSQRISALNCVPTLLATIDQDIPGLRFLLVSGEACPQDLIARWYRDDRRFLNVYGPTEATVTATWTPLHPMRRVTIGVPLPTYSVVVLDPESDRPLPVGAVGEIGLAGIALATGYLNRPDLTEKAFIPDTIGIPNNPGGRIYRTGDLGRIDENGEIEYQGRIDTQVKIRGYRIELTEIESVLLQLDGIAAAVVEPYEPQPGTVELVAYYSLRQDTLVMEERDVLGHLRDRLPRYMVPAFLEQLDAIPLTPSDKVDRKRLPPPRGRRMLGSQEYVPPVGPLETALAEALSQALGLDSVSAQAHFFDDLAGTSILMARFCASARKIPDLSQLAISDIYLHPSVQQLAATFEPADAAGGRGAPAGAVAAVTSPPQKMRTESPPQVSGLRYALCGIAQMVILGTYTTLMTWAMVIGLQWMTADADTFIDAYERAVAFGLMMSGAMFLLPVAAKWLLIGRWKEEEFPAWGLRYLRFWTVRMLVRLNPAALFVGSPVVVWYLRALGAKIGPRVTILTPHLPVCTDLITIGADTVIRKNVAMNGYRTESGRIQTGPITIGKFSYIGEWAVLDIFTSLGNRTQLGNASALLRGQHIPHDQKWHGSPARPTTTNYQRVSPMSLGRLRPMVFGIAQLFGLLVGFGPVITALMTMLAMNHQPGIVGALLGHAQLPLTEPLFYPIFFTSMLMLFLVGILTAMVFVFTVPRLLNLGLQPDRIYKLYGVHYVVQRAINVMTNSNFLMTLFGDSVYITGFLSRIGYRLKPLLQTGSNFGCIVNHESPFLVKVGHNTMISDGLTFLNADFSSSSFRLSQATLGKSNYIGNMIVLPSGARIGDDCLLGTKVLVPIDGPIREGVGLVGSPPFEIPRAVNQNDDLLNLDNGRLVQNGIRAKTRYNRISILLFLLNRWLHLCLMTLLTIVAFDLQGHMGLWVLPVAFFLMPWVSAWYMILAEQVAMGFKPIEPTYCSIYNRAFWRVERNWKMGSQSSIAVFNGTPFKSWFLRAMGVKVGKRLFDDGGFIVDRTLVGIGDNVTLGDQSTLQCHSMEDGIFKAERVEIGNNCTVGTRGFVHYGTVMNDHSVLEADSFLMKGEQIPAGQRWLANPARPAP